MADYIEREYTLDAIKKYFPRSYRSLNIFRDIKELPAADVAEVRRGKWIDTCVRDWRCSECDCEIQKIRHVDGYCYNDLPNYCPNCGARMDKEDERDG